MTSNPRYSMTDSLDIRCSRCGYGNSPEFRFCGMCGASLRPQDAVPEDLHALVNLAGTEAKIETMPVEPLLAELTAAQMANPAGVFDRPQPDDNSEDHYVTHVDESRASQSRHESAPEPQHGQRTPIPVSGPSFLGLSETGDHGAEYLLEDEPRAGRKVTGLVVLTLLAAVGGLFWHWHRVGYPLTTSGPAMSSPLSSPPSSSSSDTTASLPSKASPPTASEQKLEKPKTEAGEAPVPNDNNDKNDKAEAAPAAQSNTLPETQSAPTPTVQPKPARSALKPPAASGARTSTNLPVRAYKPAPLIASALNPEQDSSYQQGQRYLYGGGGVSPNCARAQQYLTAAANNNNSKAESTLGTMYATGHCVSRNLPLAYRWFARALHADPRNRRLERDVEIMWNQMNPQEKQVALKNQ